MNLEAKRKLETIRILSENYAYSPDGNDFVTVDSVADVLISNGVSMCSRTHIASRMGEAMGLHEKATTDRLTITQPDGSRKQKRIFRHIVKI